MSAIKITYGSEYLTELSCNGGLTCSRITGEDDVHRHLLLFSQSALCTLNSILHGISDLSDCTLHLSHADEVIKILEDLLDRTLLWHIPLDISLLHHCCLSTSGDKLSEDILSCLHRQVCISEGLILYLYLIFEETLQMFFCLRSIVSNTITCLKAHLTDVCQFLISW